MERKDVWSSWYNTDRPWVGSGDVESVARIQNLYGKICRSGYSIVGAQCRDLDDHVTFDSTSEDYSKYDFLATPCTAEGLACVNSQQPSPDGSSQMCHDYAVRFRCKYTNNEDNTLFPQFDVRIYIILAVFPILIFLIRLLWAYVFRRRRQRRREARRAARQRAGEGYDDDDTSSVASGLANPPPSYHQIFGERGKEGVFAISRDNVPCCTKCATTPCSIAYILKLNTNRQQTRSGSSSSAPISSPTQAQVHTVQETSPTLSTSQEDQQQRTGLVSPSTPLEQEQLTPEVTSSENEGAHGTANGQEAGGSRSGFSSHRESIDSVDSYNPHKKLCALSSNATLQTYIEARNESSPPGLLSDCISESVEPVSPHGSQEFASMPHSSQGIELEERSSPVPTESYSQIPSASTAGHDSPATTNDVSSSTTTTNTSNRQPDNSPALFSPLDSTTLDISSISQPCACACHRTIPFEGSAVMEYDNAGFVPDDAGTAQASCQFPGMHQQVPGLHRVWSNVSVGSVVTLSELPSYEDALELIKKKEAEQTAE